MAHAHARTNFLLSCPSLFSTRQALYLFNTKYLEANTNLEPLVNICPEIDPIQFWRDCSTMSPRISAVQLEGESLLSGLFKLTRNFCHGQRRGEGNEIKTRSSDFQMAYQSEVIFSDRLPVYKGKSENQTNF